MDKKMEYMKKKFEMNLLQGKYGDAEKYIEKMAFDDVRDMIMTIAYNTENISIYGFIQYMIYTTKRAEWLELAIDVMLNPLCFTEGAYSIALFHSRELLTITKSVKNLERILFFYNSPEKLVDEEEAQRIAAEILSIEPENIVALGVQNKSNIS